MISEKSGSGNTTGYYIPASAIIRQIQNLLSDSYKEGFSIIKEIIQNANDGGARRLDIGISKGLENTTHPLLQNLSLFFVNDGNFTDEDAKAISWFAMDINAENSTKIGKFGLGQKSIFYFCDAFFYIARSESLRDNIDYKFVNPYAEFDYNSREYIDRKYPKWINFTEKDKGIIEKYLKNSLPLEKQYFILWVPLRIKQDGSQNRRNISRKYYDEDSIYEHLPKDMSSKIAMLLPMLRWLKEVYFWCPNDTGNLGQKFHVSLENNAKRSSYPKPKHEWQKSNNTKEEPLVGKISLAQDSKIIYGGIESIIGAEKFDSLLKGDSKKQDFWHQLENSEYWLKILSEDKEVNELIVPDKAIPHCAVIFSRKKAQATGTLTVQWAVFLPIGDEEKDTVEFESVNCEGNWDYTILLHGYFFVDSGRHKVKILKDVIEGNISQKDPRSENEMVEQWNNILATSGTLSYLLPALAKFCSQHRINQEQIESICKSILSTKIFRSIHCHKYLYSKYYWVYKVHPDKCSWQLIEKAQNFLALPSIPEEIWNIFPELNEYANNYCLVSKNSPNLLGRDDVSPWEEEQIITIITNLDVEELFSQTRYIEFLANLLEQLPNSLSKKLQNSLKNIIKQGFIQINIDNLKPSKEIISKLIARLDEYNWFDINCNYSNTLQKILPVNQKPNLDILIIPKEFAPHRERLPVLNGNDAGLIIDSIINVNCRNNDLENNQELIKEIIDRIKRGEIQNFIKNTSDLKFIPGFDYRQNQEIYYSPDEIIKIEKKKLLFKDSSESREVAKYLQEALKDMTIVLVNSEYLRKLLTKEPVCCTKSTCFQVLKNKPILSDANNRRELLKQLL
jgi:hypothetical protein